jgi:hypothetical protein
MKIEKIHLDEVDDSLKLLQPSRMVSIKTDKGIVISPTRCATSYEFNKKAELPTEIPVDNKVSIYVKKFTGKEISDLLTANFEYGKQLEAIERVDRNTEYSILHVCAFQLSETAKNGKPPIEILKEKDNLRKFLRFMIDMQHDAKHDIISIPHLELPISQVKRILKEANDAIERLGKQALFSLDLRYRNFPELLDYVSSDLQPKLINLIYRKKRDVPQHYDYLGKFARKDIAFLMHDIDRIDFNADDISTMHYMPFLGNDFFAVEIPPPAIPKEGDFKKEKNIASLKILNDNDLTIKPITTSGVSTRKILEDIGNPINDELDIKLNSIQEAKTDNIKYKILNALTRVHELKVSTKEFSSLSDHIGERSSIDYVKNKTDFINRLRKV